jgi:hypothetical protein
MDVSVLTMPKAEALKQFEVYKEAVARSRGAADRLIMKSLKALSEGLGILNLREALAKGGTNETTYLPKLAVMRADQPLVYFKRDINGSGLYSNSSRYGLSYQLKKKSTARLQFRIPEGALIRYPSSIPWEDHWNTYSAPVPPIPPQFRPADSYSKYCILWEVETWSPVIPPDDPILLRPLGGDLYVVCAHWDLTEIEKLVLGAILGN